MVTRLKNSMKRQGERWKGWFTKERGPFFLAGSLIVTSVFLTLTVIYYQYYNYYLHSWEYIDGYQFSAFFCFLLMFLSGFMTMRGLFFHRKMLITKLSGGTFVGDRIKTELLVILLCYSSWKWRTCFIFYSTAVWGKYPINDRLDILFAFVLHLTIVLFVFYGSLLLLVRQWLLGIMKQTSLIWSEVWRYRNRTPVEIRMQNRRKGALVLALLFLAVGAFAGMLSMGVCDPTVGFLVIVSCAGLFLLFIKNGYTGRMQREVGCLTYQIQCMTEDREIPQENILTEQSALYEASQQLLHIDTAMKKSMEKQIQTERLKIDLITNLSHDLKTPMTSMVGYTDLLKKEELSAEARDYVGVISLKQEQLKNMIQDLFDLSKATSGETQMAIEVLDMRRLLEQTLGNMEDAVCESGREIRTSYQDEPLLFEGDNGKMYRVVQNLLENSLKYSMEGTRIYLEARRKGSQVEMQLKNIASYEMDFNPEEIMERFVRGDKSRTTQGHGLGLAIASGFVHNMGGTLEVSIDGDLFKVVMRFPFRDHEQRR